MKPTLPIYKALVTDEATGIFAISLVDMPATDTDFMAFNNDLRDFNFSIDNEEERVVSGVIMLADTPIYRRNGDFEFYVCYDRDTLKTMAEKMLIDGTFNNVDTQHNGKMVGGVNLLELYIKDAAKGLDPNYVKNVPDGSLMGSFKVENDEIWAEIKNGTFRGFSLAGSFKLEEKQTEIQHSATPTIEDEILDLINQLLNKKNNNQK